MTSDRFASLREDLSAEPLHMAVRDTLKRLVVAGTTPQDVVVAAFETVTALSVDVSGIDATSGFLLSVARKAAQASPDMRRLIGQHIQALAELVEQIPVQEEQVRH